jgi:hypothetical protein
MQTENDTSKPEDSPKQESGEGCPGASCSALLEGIEIVMPQGMMGAEKDYLVDSIIRAIAESHAEEGEWSDKYGTNIETDKFMMHRFCWCEMDNCPWCWDEEEQGEQKPNFHYKPTDFRVSWYKYIGRGMTMNRQISIEECSRILADCIKPNAKGLATQEGANSTQKD